MAEIVTEKIALAAPLAVTKNIYDLSPARLAEEIQAMGQPSYRASQVLRWLYKELVADFSQMTNLPLDLRERLAERFHIGSATLTAQKISTDGWTRKVLLKMRDGNTIEAVLMLYYDRATVCVSSQVGCAMGCNFCATGQMGFTRNLTAGEILEQVIWFNRWLKEHPHVSKMPRAARPRYEGKSRPVARRPLDESAWHVSATGFESGAHEPIRAVTNIVFMGMGEPLVNYANLWTAIRTLCSPQAVGMSPRRLTVSTVGVVPQIKRFASEELAVNLAVSLHAPNDSMRSSMMPMNDRYPLAQLMEACKEYSDKSHRRVTFEYVLINGVNDSLGAAHELAALVEGLLCHVNLIPLNPVPGTGMQATPREQVFAFQRVLEEASVPTTVRIERGVDIAAACGQLKVSEEPGARHRSLNPDLVKAHVTANLAASSAVS